MIDATVVAAVTDMGDRHIRLDYTSATPPAAAGLVYQMRLTEREHPGVFIADSGNVTLCALMLTSCRSLA